jgi:hypothetical protein
MCESPTVFRAEAVKSKIVRICEDCLRQIEPGELHEYVWGIWEGEPENIRVCAECYEVREELKAAKREGGGLYEEEILCDVAFGRLREAMMDECREVDAANQIREYK